MLYGRGMDTEFNTSVSPAARAIHYQRGHMVYDAVEYAVKGRNATRGTLLSRQMGRRNEGDCWLIDWANGVRSIKTEKWLVLS